MPTFLDAVRECEIGSEGACVSNVSCLSQLSSDEGESVNAEPLRHCYPRDSVSRNA